ncbi:hypothetical protein CKA32_003974 [Geitlerinema sp. FC II]|nr:hypothetical protein CKA32_003974 [Geitlerinema sp. FC II]
MGRQKLKTRKNPIPCFLFPLPFLSQFCYTTDLGLPIVFYKNSKIR